MKGFVMYYISFPGLGIEPFHIDKAAFTLFGRSVAWYGILITCGMVLAVLFGIWVGKKENVSSDDILDLIYKLKRPYRKNASFIMNDATLAQIRKLKDNNGQYLWQPSYQANEPDKILGYNIRTSAFAPTDAIAFGDYKYYNIGDRGSLSFKQLNELFAGNGMIGYVAKERVDGLLILPEAVKILGLKAETTTTATK